MFSPSLSLDVSHCAIRTMLSVFAGSAFALACAEAGDVERHANRWITP